MEVGPLLSSEIHYDKSGRSLGAGSVVFEERTDAIRAINQYNGIPLDGKHSIYPQKMSKHFAFAFYICTGRPMKIEIASSAPGRLIESRRIGKFRNRNAGGAGGGVGSSGGGRRRFSEF